jgi:hypothetical protein
MALVNTGRAIGAVSQTLRERLSAVLGATVDQVTIGRPEPVAVSTGSRLNLFLFEVHHDEFLRNESLDEGQAAPLWLVLRYLVTAFDVSGESDTIEAHQILGEGLRALEALNFLQPTAATTDPLRDNNIELKITFDPATVDLLSKIMQGPDQRYRCSAGFQVRPVLIAPAEPPSYSQLVGIDYTANAAIIGEDSIHIPVLPSFGPVLDSVQPLKFEVGATLVLTGTDLNLEGVAVEMAGVNLPITKKRPDRLEVTTPAAIAAGNLLSAASHPIAVVQTLPTGRKRASVPILGGLLPRVDSATESNVTPVNANPGAPVTAVIDLTGILLSTANDAAFLGLANSSNGRIARVFDQFTRPVANQTQLRLTIPTAMAVQPALYRVILRVNGQQALRSPEVDLS